MFVQLMSVLILQGLTVHQNLDRTVEKCYKHSVMPSFTLINDKNQSNFCSDNDMVLAQS